MDRHEPWQDSMGWVLCGGWSSAGRGRCQGGRPESCGAGRLGTVPITTPSSSPRRGAERGDKRNCATPKSGSPSGNGPETRANAGDRAACKAVYIGSIPVRASKRIKDIRPLLWAFSYMHSGNIGGVPLRFGRKTTRQRDDCAWTRVHHANDATAWRYAGAGSSVRRLATEAAVLLWTFRDAGGRY